ncbi:MAG: homoserine kinase [Actinomycetota bacterium]|nr:homoserine kinase [Actinomycetota bacterium]
MAIPFGPVEVRVPATSANLGPGFDCLGVALAIHLKIRFYEAATSEIAGVGRRHPIEKNLTHGAFVAAFELAGKSPPPVLIETVDAYPSARGLGASASAIVAGLVGARSMGALALEDDALALLGSEIEGHADNVLPAFFGGLLLKLSSGWLRFEPTDDLAPLVLIARDKFKTGKARQVLPPQVTRADAVSAASSTAGLVAMLTGESPPAHLLEATADRLHEPYRLPLMPETEGLHRTLRNEGIPTALSGAGPSLICLVEQRALEDARRVIRSLLPRGWTIESPGWDLEGALLTSA